MLSQQHRLPHHARLSSPRSIVTPFVVVKYAPNALGLSRFGVIVSKRVDKRAVVRNRCRRLLHQYIYEHLSLFPIGYDFLFLVQKPFTTLSDDDTLPLTSQLTLLTR